MDTTDEVPPGFEHIAEILHQTEEQLRILEEQIENPPMDKGPELNYNPPGSTTNEPPTSRERKIEEFRKQQELLRSVSFSKIEVALRGVDPETAKIIRSASMERIYPNQYKKMTAMDKKAHETIRKDIFISQDFADGQIQEAALNAKRLMKQQEQEKQAFKSMKKDVVASFGYNKVLRESDNEKMLEKEDPVKDKKVIAKMSANFTQGFSYMKVEEERAKEAYTLESEIDVPYI